MVRVIVPTLVLVGALLMPHAVTAQSEAPLWSVSTSGAREQKIVRRYLALLLKNPAQDALVRLFARRLGTAQVDQTIAKLRTQAEDTGDCNTWLLVGHLERSRSRLGAAQIAYESAVAAAPLNPLAHAALGRVLNETGGADLARASFERALELSPSTGQAKLLRNLADTSARSGDHLAAAQWLQRLTDLAPRDRGLQLELAEAFVAAKRLDVALTIYDVVLKLSPRGKPRAEVLIELAGVHLRMQNALEAERRLREALTIIAPTRGGEWMRREALVKLVDALRDLGRLAEVYEQLCREWSRPTLHDALMLADLADELGRPKETLAWLERAIRTEPGNIEARRRLIARLDPTTDRARIERLYAELIALRPNDIGERIERIEWTFFRSERPSEALNALRTLEAESVDDPQSMVAIAQSWLRLGVPDVALGIHEKLERSAPKDPQHLEAYATLLLDLGRRDEGCAVLDRLIAQERGKAGARMRAAELASRHKVLDYATLRLEEVVAEFPDLLDARQRLATMYEAREQWPEALAQWEFLFDAGKDHAAAPIIAIVRRTVFIGDTPLSPDEQALQRWERRFATMDSVRTGALLVEVRNAAGKPAEARQLARDLIARETGPMPPTERRAWFTLAQRYRDLFDVRGALALLDRMATAAPEWRAMLSHEAVGLAAQLPEAEAAEAFARLVKTTPWDGYLYATIGQHWSSQGQPERALPYLRRARTLSPQLTDAGFELVYVLRKLGQSGEAWGVLMDMVARTRAATPTLDAAFTALDLAETDAQLLELEQTFESLRGRIGADDLRAIAVAVYYALYTYGADRDELVRTTKARAAEFIIGAVASTESGDVALALELLPLFSPAEVEKFARAAWPADGRKWRREMIGLTHGTSTHWFHERFVEATRSENSNVREAATLALGASRVAFAVPRLTEAWGEQSDAEERHAIASALGRIDVEDSRTLLRHQAEDADWQHRQVAIWGLGQATSPAAAAILAQRLGDVEPGVAKFAAVMLRRMHGDAGLSLLLQASMGSDVHLKRVAEQGLRAPQVADWWGAIFTDEDLGALRNMRRVTRENYEEKPIAAALRGREGLVVETVRAQFDERALGFLVQVADETDATGDPELAKSVRDIVRGLRPELRDAAQDQDGMTLAFSAELLPRAERSADAAIVVSAIERAPATSRARILRKLGRYSWKSVRPTLLRSLDGTSAERRASALRALAAFREASRDPEVLRAARDGVATTRDDGQVAAIEILGGAKDRESVDLLAGAFEASGPRARAAIREALEAIGTDEARSRLRAFRVQPEQPVCAGNPDDLTALLTDACRGAVMTAEF